MTEPFDIDPAGDAILSVGDDDDLRGPLQLRVSTLMLSAASPVFKSMFSKGRFAEGTVLEKTKLYEASLPDDLPAAMLAYVMLCHHQHDVLKTISDSTMRNLTILIDKYQSEAQFKMLLSLWFEKKIAAVLSISEIELYLDAAYIMKDAEIFSKLCVLYTQNITPDMMPPVQWQRCPPEVHYCLAAQATKARAQVVSLAEESVRSILLGSNRHRPECRRLPYVQGMYLRYLAAYGVWPVGPMASMSVRRTIDLVKGVRSSFTCFVYDEDFCVKKGCQDRSNKIECSLGPKADLSSVYAECTGLCLHCVLAGVFRQERVCGPGDHEQAGQTSASTE